MKNLMRSIQADNEILRLFDGVTFGIHLCRGNQRSMWHREGSYDAIAEKLFTELRHDRLLLEYDSPRAGTFEPLRFVPKGKIVVLGLVSTKVPEIEKVDDLKRRIESSMQVYSPGTAGNQPPVRLCFRRGRQPHQRRRPEKKTGSRRRNGAASLGLNGLVQGSSVQRFKNSSNRCMSFGGNSFFGEENYMAIKFRADNIGSLLRPAELLEARAALRDGRMDEQQVREIEDRSILTALEMQKSAGVQVFTDGEYRRDIFTADITKAMDGLVPGKPVVKFEWRGKGKKLAEQSKEGNLQYIVGGKLRRKGRFTPDEAPFLKQHAPGRSKSARRRRCSMRSCAIGPA